MNRQLFNEVFKQISSKIDQLKSFLPPTTHLKVTKKNDRDRKDKELVNIDLSEKKTRFTFKIRI
jgi:hypothetical protein